MTIYIGSRNKQTQTDPPLLFKKLFRIINKRTCKREGWDFESNQYEKCGAHFSNTACDCHPDFCPDCCCEVHNISLMLPGVMEVSPIEHHCSAKGNH